MYGDRGSHPESLIILNTYRQYYWFNFREQIVYSVIFHTPAISALRK